MTKKTRLEDFIEKAKEVHNNKYEYTKSVYVNNRTHIIITCKEHGDFLQTPYKHSNMGQRCPKCVPNNKLTQEDFLERAKNIHGFKYEYSKVVYKSSHEKVLIGCPEHGYFLQSASVHMLGSGCPKCGFASTSKIKTKDTKFFVEKAFEAHGSKYCYLKSKYVDIFSKVTITCPLHGDFLQTANNHIHSKNGCPDCANMFRGFSKSKFKNVCDKNNEGLGTLYLIKCQNKNEVFYKVGITSLSTKKRYINKKDMPYKYEVLYEIVGKSEDIFTLEKDILSVANKYLPSKTFAGETECFLELDSVLEVIKNFK